ncbi:hypothetical protein CAPTEDRAFT_189813 [Capitella teleta]|uniref:Reverse transcriptase domain-containing protein n=1 Tax=Capitella teleta TaxID=283909 RepID=R7UDS6_CAPTE|nr:hypothetical protein CAPTEDRAFT_189813 [Capitella teleta]|eukprot:ELU04545.1 hypothetical protein CAPTEDRAFT_189813 [Capitella teleta]
MLKIATRRKHELWVSGNRHEAKRCQVELNNLIKRSKVVYKNKIERCFEENDSKSAWKSLKTITGYKKKPSNVGERNDNAEWAEQLNEFCSRFEKNDNILDITENPLTRLQVSANDVHKILSSVDPNKAMGPDNISPRLLKTCAQDLAHIFKNCDQTGILKSFKEDYMRYSYSGV